MSYLFAEPYLNIENDEARKNNLILINNFRKTFLEAFFGYPVGHPKKIYLNFAKTKSEKITINLASRRGFEPPTCPLGGGCAIQLCHRGSLSEEQGFKSYLGPAEN
jgi:hypothetical protein